MYMCVYITISNNTIYIIYVLYIKSKTRRLYTYNRRIKKRFIRTPLYRQYMYLLQYNCFYLDGIPISYKYTDTR